MNPFFKFWGEEKQLRVEDPETGIIKESSEKSFSGKVGNLNVQAKFSSFSIEGSKNNSESMLDNFSPFKLFSSFFGKSLSADETKKLENKKD